MTDTNEGVKRENRQIHQVYERKRWKPLTWGPTSTRPWFCSNKI